MPDFRAYAPDTRPDADTITLGGAESHHLVSVNRCGRGDPVVAFDGAGREWTCECVDPSKSAAVLRVKETRQATPLAGAITLAQALPKGAAMDDIVRQATELGAARIVPLVSERTQVHLDGDRAARKVEKWRTTAIEAAKQCGNPWLPEITQVQDFAGFIAAASRFELRLVASLHSGATTLRHAIAQYRAKHGRPPAQAVWLVGPEGDFSPAEMTSAVMSGFAPVSLGPLVLRSDTAATVALGLLRHELAPA